MRRLLLLALLLPLLVLPARAARTDSALERQEEALDTAGLEREGRSYLDGLDLTLDDGLDGGLEKLLDTGTRELGGVVRRAMGSAVLLVLVVLLCAVGEGALGETGRVPAVSLAGTLGVLAVAVGDVRSLMGLGTSAIDAMASFSNVLLPTVAAVTAATGAVTGAAARQMAAALFSGLLMNLIRGVLIPLLYGYMALTAAWAAVGNDGLRRVAALLKWAAVTMLTVVMLAYVGYLTVSGVVARPADALAVKAAKAAISGAVPVVGGILADASESVLAAAGILRGTVGVFGMLIVLGICLAPFLHLAVHYLFYKAAAALSAAVGGGRIPALVEQLGSAFGMILGMTGACALLLLVSLVSSLMVVTV